jgi:predicted ATP-grasp superfamily ATP-dependent carboligase
MSRILITGVRMWYAYNSVNLLAKEGHEIYVAESSKLSMGLYSKLIKKSFIYPDISEKSEEFIETIIQIIEDYDIDYILPVFEETYVLSYYKDRLKGKVKIMLPKFDTIWELHDKYSLFKLAEDLRIPTPKTVLLKEFDFKKLNFPFDLKPRRERGAIGIKVINNEEEYNHYLKNHDLDDYIVQEYVDQDQYCTIGLAKNGKLISNTVYHNLEEYPYKGGFGIVRESLDIKIINHHVEKIVKKKKYTGFICMDFLKSPEEQVYKITDINPRMSPGLMIAYSEGIDLPNIYIKAITNENFKDYFSKGGRGTYTGALRIGWLLQVIFSGNFKMLKGFLKRRKNKIEDVWNWKDAKPFFVFFAHLLLSSTIGPKVAGSQQNYYYKRTTFDHRKFLPDNKGWFE